MPEIDLEALIAKAEEVQDDIVMLTRASNKQYRVFLYNRNGPHGVQNATFDECVKQIREWATPPKPDMLPVLVPIATAEFAASEEVCHRSECNKHSRIISEACREALAPYQQPE